MLIGNTPLWSFLVIVVLVSNFVTFYHSYFFHPDRWSGTRLHSSLFFKNPQSFAIFLQKVTQIVMNINSRTLGQIVCRVEAGFDVMMMVQTKERREYQS